MILTKNIYSHGSSRVKAKDLNKIIKIKDITKIFNKHGLIKRYKQEMIKWKIIQNHWFSRIITKNLNKFLINMD